MDNEVEKRPGHCGVIILAHGSKVKATKDTVRRVVGALKKKLRLKYIMPAYLQFCRPSLPQAVERLVGRGCAKIVITPYFLFNGSHVSRDIPLLLEGERARFPQVELVYTKGLAEDGEKISEIITCRIREVI